MSIARKHTAKPTLSRKISSQRQATATAGAARQVAAPAGGSAAARKRPLVAAPAIAPTAPATPTAEPAVGKRKEIRKKALKPPKLKKPKPVRDSFTMPRAEYQLIELLKQRAAARGHKVKKSELLRAGILALAGMSDARLFAAIAAVPVVDTGRPSAQAAAAAAASEEAQVGPATQAQSRKPAT